MYVLAGELEQSRGNHSIKTNKVAQKILGLTSKFWVIVTVVGQLIFATYVALYYGGSAARGDMGAWNKVFPQGYVAGDSLGNTVMASHLALAVVIILGGIFQLIPQIRTHAPKLHRWNGRIYVLVAFVMSASGIFMGAYRGSVGGTLQHYGIALNGILIMIFAVMTWQRAWVRNFRAHQQWAMRLFLAVSGVWFFRVLLMLWIVANQGPAGFDPQTFEGPFLIFLSFSCFLLPLLVYEMYLKARDSKNALTQYFMSATLFVCTLGIAVGVASATAFMWIPRLQ